MARKTLEDFDNDYQAYADYLESAECADDEGYDIYADEKGNIYERTEGSWVKGHGHNNINDSRPPREPNDPQSYGRKWYNRWLKYMDRIQLSEDEIQLLEKYLEIEKTNKLSKKFSLWNK